MCVHKFHKGTMCTRPKKKFLFQCVIICFSQSCCDGDRRMASLTFSIIISSTIFLYVSIFGMVLSVHIKKINVDGQNDANLDLILNLKASLNWTWVLLG